MSQMHNLTRLPSKRIVVILYAGLWKEIVIRENRKLLGFWKRLIAYNPLYFFLFFSVCFYILFCFQHLSSFILCFFSTNFTRSSKMKVKLKKRNKQKKNHNNSNNTNNSNEKNTIGWQTYNFHCDYKMDSLMKHLLIRP